MPTPFQTALARINRREALWERTEPTSQGVRFGGMSDTQPRRVLTQAEREFEARAILAAFHADQDAALKRSLRDAALAGDVCPHEADALIAKMNPDTARDAARALLASAQSEAA